MIVSAMFVCLFLLCLLGVLLFPKTEGKINGTKALIMGTMLIFCYMSLTAFLFDKTGIGVHLKTTVLALAVACVFLWGVILKKKKIQRVFFRVWDIVTVVLLLAFVFAISMHLFTPNLRLSYVNSDPANHFNMAMQIVKNGTLDGIYFSAYIDATFIELLAPVLTVGKYYKAFIVADIFLHLLEICMFYVLTLTISEKGIVRIFAPVFAIGYFFGFPSYSYMTGGYVYWSTGVMILIFIIYALLLVEKYPDLRRYTYVLLFFGAYANSCCNRLFVPVNYLALLAALIVILAKGKKNWLTKKTICVAGVLLIITVIAAVVFFHFWGSFDKIFAYVSVVGWTYNSMYADLIFFVPLFLFVLFYTVIKREYSNVISVMALCMLACTIAMYVLTYQKLMTYYYYYKIYYNLWLFGWLFAVMALHVMAEKKQLVSYFSYGIMIAGIAALVLFDYEGMMWKHDANFNGDYATRNLFSLYRYNMDSMETNYLDYTKPKSVMDVYMYAAEQMEGERIQPLITDQGAYCWFDAMKAQDRGTSKKFWPSQYELMDIVKRLDKAGIEYVAVLKVDEFYQTNQEYFSLCEEVYGNETAAILKRPGESWTGIVRVMDDYSKDKLQLYRYVKKHLSGERVPLMADRSASVDYIIYRKRAKQKMTDCYPWNFDPKENLENLNSLGIKYMLVFYDDPYYQSISSYLDRQETVFENEAGKIVRCNGDSWSTSYQ